MTQDALTLVAVYRRTVRASLARVWENVLDWEHLPWLHRTSFCSVELLARETDFWRVKVTLPPKDADREATVEVRLDRPALSYLTRTTAGFGVGTEILTYLEPVDDQHTRVAVEFRAPDVEPNKVVWVGDAYTRLYTQLWNEDEAMMIRRTALLEEARARTAGVEAQATPQAQDPLPLGPTDQLRRRLPLLVMAHGRRYRIVDVDGVLRAHPTVCPHLGGPLDDVPVIDGCITCPWHGYRYDVRTGRNTGDRPVHLDHAPGVLVDPRSSEAFLVFAPPPRH